MIMTIDEKENAAAEQETNAAPTTTIIGAGSTASESLDTILDNAIHDYLETQTISLIDLVYADRTVRRKECSRIRDELIESINGAIELKNALRAKTDQMRKFVRLPGHAIARILIASGDVRSVRISENDVQVAARHYAGGKWSGTYRIIRFDKKSDPIMRCMHQLNPSAGKSDIESFQAEMHDSPYASINADDKIIFLRNGVWDYRTKSLTTYDDTAYDEKYGDRISFTKLPVHHPYGPGAKLAPDANGHIDEPEITMPDGEIWRPSTVLSDPFDQSTAIGQASTLVLWQATQFMIRKINGAPRVYHMWINAGGKGHNGKSTISEMMQRLITIEHRGDDDDDLTSLQDRVISASIDELDSPYVLGQNILSAYMILGKEMSAPGKSIEKSGRFKKLSRAEECLYRGIFEAPFSYRFSGLLVQQSNEFPKFQEKNDSVISHIIALRFEKSFDDSRSYIKDDYILREEVAEWLIYRLTCEMPCLDRYGQDLLDTLAENRERVLTESMNTFQFFDDCIPGIHMDCMPAEMLYSIYRRWCDISGVAGRAVVTEKAFRRDMEQYGINNRYGIAFHAGPKKCSKKDLKELHPALLDYGSTRSLGLSDFVDHKSIEFSNQASRSLFAQMLDENRFLRPDGSARVWTKGCLVRTVSWRDVKPSMQDAEDEE